MYAAQGSKPKCIFWRARQDRERTLEERQLRGESYVRGYGQAGKT